MFRPEFLVLVGQKRLEHLLSAAADVMAIDGDILTRCAVAGFAQGEQRTQRTLGAIESVSQVVIRVIAAYHRIIHIGAGNLQPRSKVGILALECHQVSTGIAGADCGGADVAGRIVSSGIRTIRVG